MVLNRLNLITPAGKTSAVPREDSKRGSRAPRADKIWVDLPAPAIKKRARGGGGGEVVEKFVRALHLGEKKGQENLFSTTERKRHLHLNKTRRSTASGLSQETEASHL